MSRQRFFFKRHQCITQRAVRTSLEVHFLLEGVRTRLSKVVTCGFPGFVWGWYVCVGGRADPYGRIKRGRDPDPPPLENYKNIGFLSNTGSNPLKITMLGHHRPASETPLKWPANSGIWILLPLIKLKKHNKKRCVKVGSL